MIGKNQYNIYYICQVFKLIKYPVSGRIFSDIRQNPVSSWIVKITIRCTLDLPTSRSRIASREIDLSPLQEFGSD